MIPPSCDDRKEPTGIFYGSVIRAGGLMKCSTSVTTLLFALGIVACAGDGVSPDLGQLVGEWRPPTVRLQPRGTMDGLFAVAANGATENHVISRGLYGQSANELSMESVLYGQIRISGDKFLVTPDSLVTHDVFYGPSHRDVQRDFTGWPRDSTRFAIRANVLELEFYSYPADAPVLTHQVLYRVR